MTRISPSTGFTSTSCPWVSITWTCYCSTLLANSIASSLISSRKSKSTIENCTYSTSALCYASIQCIWHIATFSTNSIEVWATQISKLLASNACFHTKLCQNYITHKKKYSLKNLTSVLLSNHSKNPHFLGLLRQYFQIFGSQILTLHFVVLSFDRYSRDDVMGEVTLAFFFFQAN